MTGGPVTDTSVGRRLASVLTLLIVLLFATGGLGLLSAFLSFRAVQHLTNVVQPASSANAAILQDLTDAETGVRAWGLSGNTSALEPYRTALERLPEDERALTSHLPEKPGLRSLVDDQEHLTQRWLKEYAELRVSRPGGSGSYSPALFFHGKELFDELRAVHARIQKILDADVSDARDMAVKRVRRTGIAIAIFTLLGVTLAARSGGRLLREIRDPLEDLESVVQRLAEGDLSARARERGPREVRLVARALNTLAEESERTRAAEASFTSDVRALDTARGDFVSNVSHELRTPLTVLSGYLEIVEDEFSGGVSDHHQRMIDASRRNVDRLSALINDLLTLSRAENRSTDLEQVDLRVLVRDAVEDLRMASGRREVVLTKQLPDDVVLVLADRGQLVRAIVNIIGNAVKFSPAGAEVQVRVESTADEAVLVVVDHGIGIPESELSALGTRFFRASNAMAAEVPGTGLGLRIVQSIVDNHAGSVTVDSVEGEGTTVTIRLPITG